MNTTSFNGNYARDEHPLPNKTGRTGMYLNYFIIKTVDKWLCVYGIGRHIVDHYMFQVWKRRENLNQKTTTTTSCHIQCIADFVECMQVF